MTWSPCVNCDRPSHSYHGSLAYCGKCLPEARREDPDAHRCTECGTTQPSNVAWFRAAPCDKCQRGAKATDYDDPRWQRTRLRIFERDKWACTQCGATTRQLHVHHVTYRGKVWDAADRELRTLCEQCHADTHGVSKR